MEIAEEDQAGQEGHPLAPDAQAHQELGELARRAAASDHAAFHLLVEQTHRLIFRVCLRLCFDREQAEDLTQDTYLRAWQALPRLRDPNTVLGWLTTIARNAARDRARFSARRPTLLSLDAAFNEVDVLHQTVGPEEACLRRQQQVLVLGALERVKEKYRLPLMLREVDGLSGPEVAELLGLPLGTVESRTARGRNALAKILRSQLKDVPS